MSGIHRKKCDLNIVLVGLSTDTGNLGVSALAEGTIEGLLQAAPDVRLCVVDAGVGPSCLRVAACGRAVAVPVHAVRFSPRAIGVNHIGAVWAKALFWRLVPFEGLRSRVVRRGAALQALVGADAVLDISGGDSFSDIYGARRMVYQFVFKLLLLILKKRLVLLPQTIGPFRKYPWRALARLVLRKSELIYTRDRAGAAEVVRFMGKSSDSRVHYAPDVGFLVRPGVASEALLAGRSPRPRLTVGLNVSGLLWNGGYTRANQFGLKTDYRRVIARVLDDLLREEGVRVLLVPHVVTLWRGGVENDEKACQDVRAQLRDGLRDCVEVVCGLGSAGQAKGVIGGCDFFIGSRMHSCIAALSQCIPAVGIAYSDKFRGVFEALGVGGCVVDARREDEEGILRVVRNALARRNEIRATLGRVVPTVQEQARSTFREIVELICNGDWKHQGDR